MELQELRETVAEWAAAEELVIAAYIFGSRARGDHRPDSDLDVAIELKRMPGDGNTLATWMFEKDGLVSRLSSRLPFKLQLEHFDGERTPTIEQGLAESSIKVYGHEET